MSLESQIAALVSAANSLTSQVAGKMDSIDREVKNATEAVPSEIRNQLALTFHVDEVNGDDGNSGSNANNPLKSLSRALQLSPNGASVRIVAHSDITKFNANHNDEDDYSREQISVRYHLTIDLNNNSLLINTSRSAQGGQDVRLSPRLRFVVNSFCSLSIANGEIRISYLHHDHIELPASNSPQDGVFRVGESSIRFFNVTCAGGVEGMKLVTLDGWSNARAFLTVSTSQFTGQGVLRFGSLGGRDHGDIWLSTYGVTFEEGWQNITDPD